MHCAYVEAIWDATRYLRQKKGRKRRRRRRGWTEVKGWHRRERDTDATCRRRRRRVLEGLLSLNWGTGGEAEGKMKAFSLSLISVSFFPRQFCFWCFDVANWLIWALPHARTHGGGVVVRRTIWWPGRRIKAIETVSRDETRLWRGRWLSFYWSVECCVVVEVDSFLCGIHFKKAAQRLFLLWWLSNTISNKQRKKQQVDRLVSLPALRTPHAIQLFFANDDNSIILHVFFVGLMGNWGPVATIVSFDGRG